MNRQTTNAAQVGAAAEGSAEQRRLPPVREITAAVAGVAAAWMVAGATGLMAHPLQHALSWIAVGVVVAAAWPGRLKSGWDWGGLVAGLAFAAALLVPVHAAVNLAAVTVLLMLMAGFQQPDGRRVLWVAGAAVGILTLWRWALTAIPSVWLAADWLGAGLGRLAGAVASQPLSIGATFAGLDYLVTLAALIAGWLIATEGPRWRRAAYAVAAVVVAHLGYLAVLAWSPQWVRALPVPTPPTPDAYTPTFYAPPAWFWSDAIRAMVPWNVPLLAWAVHLGIVATMFRWAVWRPDVRGESSAGRVSTPFKAGRSGPSQTRKILVGETAPDAPIYVVWGPIVLAAVLPVLTGFAPAKADLSGRKVVAFAQGNLDWEKPVHDRYGRAAAGQYGMLPILVECLGGEFVRSAELSEADLAGADLLIVIHPFGSDPWPADRLERVWSYVRAGGAMLVVGEPWAFEGGRSSRFEEVLKPTAILVRPAVAVGATSRWEQSLELPAHPAVAGLGDRRNAFGLSECAALRVRWPARPLLVGRWGFADPGSDSVLTGVAQYDGGERLGDLVLAAEQRIGRGTVVVVGDAGGWKNEGLAAASDFTGRLLGYLAHPSASPQAIWRQILGLLGMVALAWLLIAKPDPARVPLIATVLALSMLACEGITAAEGRVVLGRDGAPRVACIDAAHLNAFSGELWSDNGIAGLSLALARDGYLPRVVSELDGEQLTRARLMVCIAPVRPFSARERWRIQEFLKRGGIFICTAGAEHAAAVRPLLADLPVDLCPVYADPGRPVQDPIPLGYAWVNYTPLADKPAQVMHFAGWPIDCDRSKASVLTRDTQGRPTAVAVAVGSGYLVLVGDSAFALNKNLEPAPGQFVLEREDGTEEPTDGVRQNTYFWRWLLADLSGKTGGLPDPPPIPRDVEEDGTPAAAQGDSSDKAQAKEETR